MLVHIGLKIVKSISVMLLFTKRQIFRLVQTESITDDKINVIEKLKFCLERVENIVGKGENGGEFFKKGRKHCGKRKNCLLRAISPVPTVFSKDLYCRHIKNQGFFGKGLTLYQTTKFGA